jgi:hypothetical protein
MIPIIYICNDADALESFVAAIIKEQNILPYYVFRIEPIKTELSIDQIRAVKKEVITDSPTIRFFIFNHFDTASLEAQNAFLKTLEEKNGKNIFLMVVTSIGRVLPTIQSRSKVVSNKKNDIGSYNNDFQDMFNKIEQSSDFSFLSSVSAMNRENAVSFFDMAILHLEKKLIHGKVVTAELLKKALQQKSLLLNNNLNPQLAVDAFLIFYKKKITMSS